MAKLPVKVPPVGTGKRGVDGYLTYLLRQANAMMRGAMERRLAGTGLTFPQYSSLVMINAYPDLSSADLARVTLLTPQTINEVVRTLERGGLIERNAHPTHRRILCIRITADGAARMADARARTREIEERMNRDLDGEDAERIRRWLARVATEFSEG